MVIGPAESRLEPSGDRPNPVQLALAGKAVSDLETCHLSLAGDRKFLSFTAKPLFDDAGVVIGARGTARNVTARAAARETSADLERHLSLLRSLINNTPDLIFYKDPRGVYKGCNHAFELFVGVPDS